MLYLLCTLGGERYLLPTRAVVEVLPLAALRPLPHAPACVAGLMDYRGHPLPVLDLCQLLADGPCAQRLSSRIVVARLRDGDGPARELGLLVERATETLKLSPEELRDPGIAQTDAAYLGRIARDTQGLLQEIDTAHILGRVDERLLFGTDDVA